MSTPPITNPYYFLVVDNNPSPGGYPDFYAWDSISNTFDASRTATCLQNTYGIGPFTYYGEASASLDSGSSPWSTFFGQWLQNNGYTAYGNLCYVFLMSAQNYNKLGIGACGFHSYINGYIVAFINADAGGCQVGGNQAQSISIEMQHELMEASGDPYANNSGSIYNGGEIGDYCIEIGSTFYLTSTNGYQYLLQNFQEPDGTCSQCQTGIPPEEGPALPIVRGHNPDEFLLRVATLTPPPVPPVPPARPA